MVVRVLAKSSILWMGIRYVNLPGTFDGFQAKREVKEKAQFVGTAMDVMRKHEVTPAETI